MYFFITNINRTKIIDYILRPNDFYFSIKSFENVFKYFLQTSDDVMITFVVSEASDVLEFEWKRIFIIGNIILKIW